MRTWSGPAHGDRRGALRLLVLGALWVIPLTLAVLVGHPAAATAAGPDNCPNAAIRVEQGSENLSDCRAYELVSPADKGPGGYVGSISAINSSVSFQAARSGQGFVFDVAYGLPDATAGGPVTYSADRAGTGWTPTQITPPALVPPYMQSQFSQTGIVIYSAPDLSCSLVASFEPLTSDTPQAMIDAGQPLLYRRAADGTDTLLTPQVPTNIAAATSVILPATYLIQGVSADCSHIVFTAPFTYPGVDSSAFSIAKGLYEWSDGAVRNVAVRPDGTVATGATAGYLQFGNGSAWNAVSSDGSRIFFSATSNAGGDSGKTALFLRKDGQSTIDVSQSKTATVNQGAVYQVASKAGDHVLFLANYGLTSTPSSGPTNVDCTMAQTACDLYDYDVASGDLTDLSADATPANTNGATVAGVLGASDDASYVYFAAQGQLVPGKGSTYATNVTAKTYNVYLAHGGTLAYVGALNQSDLTGDPSGALLYPNSMKNNGASTSWRSRVTPDGRHLLFSSAANVTGYDSGGVAEAYRYSADTDTTVCVSCREDGLPSVGRSTGDAYTWTAPLPLVSNNPLNPPVTLTDHGSRVFFTMPDMLASGAVSGNANVYEWHDGHVSLLATDIAPSPITGAAAGGLQLFGASASGDDVFIGLGKQLVPQDIDLRFDAYDIRVGGGFPMPPAPPAPCDPLADGACPGPSVSPPGPLSLGTSVDFGAGNVPAPPAPQPKPKQARLKVAKPKTVRGTSTRVTVKVSEKGKIRTSGSGLRRSSKTVKKAGTYRVSVKLSTRAKRILKRKGRVKVRVTVRFTPKHGKQQRERVHVTFRSKAAKKHGSRAVQRAAAVTRGTTVSVDAHGKVR